MFKIRGTVASQTKQLEAQCDFKLKKPKAASGILMIRQNSFHEIPSLLCLNYILISFRVAKSDLNSTDAYFAKKISTKKWPKSDQK